MIAAVCRAYPAYRPLELLTVRADLVMDMLLGANEMDELSAGATTLAVGPDGLVRRRNADGSTSVSAAGGPVEPGPSLVGQLGRLGSLFTPPAAKGGE